MLLRAVLGRGKPRFSGRRTTDAQPVENGAKGERIKEDMYQVQTFKFLVSLECPLQTLFAIVQTVSAPCFVVQRQLQLVSLSNKSRPTGQESRASNSNIRPALLARDKQQHIAPNNCQLLHSLCLQNISLPILYLRISPFSTKPVVIPPKARDYSQWLPELSSLAAACPG